MKLTTILLTVCLGLTLLSFAWPNKLEQKVKETISKTYETTDYKLSPISVSDIQEANTKAKINGCFYSIQSDQKKIGYIYVGEAPSMKNVFDYVVLFSPSLEIVNTKILIYREQHGQQIGSKRWLNQFLGLTPNSIVGLGINIDGISGATISVNGMTNAVKDVLSSIQKLQKEKIL